MRRQQSALARRAQLAAACDDVPGVGVPVAGGELAGGGDPDLGGGLVGEGDPELVGDADALDCTGGWL